MLDRLITLENVSVVFKDGLTKFKALDDVSLELSSGEILGIIGESGSGKSTIAKVITGIYEPSEGRVCLEEKDITKRKRSQRKEIYKDVQMVFQNSVGSFNPRRKIGSSIEETLMQLCAMSSNEAKSMVSSLLNSVGLKDEYAFKYPHELSGGECQRAAIARAMAVKPKILICDEATSALDVSAQARIVQLLAHLKEEHHMGMIFISHDLPLVSALTDRILIMNKGRIVEQGYTSEVIKNPKSTYTKELLEAAL